jgi:class 3 adenylate cyclase
MDPSGTGRVERRLAAILAADVADYSRLIETDEEGTLARLKTLRADVIDPRIAGHKGRIVKTTGDGLLIEFASVVARSDAPPKFRRRWRKAMRRTRRTAASNSASASIRETSSSRTMTSSVTA